MTNDLKLFAASAALSGDELTRWRAERAKPATPAKPAPKAKAKATADEIAAAWQVHVDAINSRFA